MKIALIGYGKMGQAIKQAASSLQVDVVAQLNSAAQKKDWKAVEHADVCIDFSHPDAVVSHVQESARLRRPMVLGTTGWDQHIDRVKAIVEENELGLIYAQNFSFGMNLFIQIVTEAAIRIDRLDDYDVAVTEMHHRQKVDSPSGTAYAIADALLQNISRKAAIHDKSKGETGNANALNISSLRVGTVPGTHAVIMDSSHDTITLTHQAHDRSAWAHGALEAAKWIQHKTGFFHFHDMMEEFTCDNPNS